MSESVEEYQFQAETKQLLNLVIHSLYTNKDIFLRELISNASDAIDRLRFEALMNPNLIETDKFEIHLEVDGPARTLTISDNGIGMSRAEVIDSIGTIAKSGTRELREKIKEGQSVETLSALIGQFGVGFYSSFMVADKVSLITRRAGEETTTRWESSGDGYYSLSQADRQGHGTSITLYLKPVDHESGIEDFTDKWILSRIVKKHSDFVSYPIVLATERQEDEYDERGFPKLDGHSTIVVEDTILNSMKPIWTRSQADVTQDEYNEFYHHISHDRLEPLQVIPLKAEGTFEYESLLFIPSTAPYDLFYHAAEFGIRLYAKRVMVMEKCQELLPRYLRFIKGIVDAADLPLNISRQTLQQDRHIVQIRKWLTKKVLGTLEEMRRQAPDKYLAFWHQFGRALKEGVSFDSENKDTILSLLLFESSYDSEQLTTLKQYTERMKEGQNEIIYITGETRSVVENSPHLEAFKEKSYEVLYLIDPVDELLVQSLPEFEGKRLSSVAKGTVKVGDEEERKRVEQELKQKEEEYAGLLALLQKKLDAHVKQVRLTNRLTTSPVCLVGSEIDYSPQLERLLQKGKGGGQKQRRIMELNPQHPVLAKLQKRFLQNAEDQTIGDFAELLLGYALLAEGSELVDPIRYNRLVADLILQTA
jgi:molecular chaperone HtpG